MYFLYRNCPFLVLMDLANETAKYIFPSRRFEARTLEEALMSGIYIYSLFNCTGFDYVAWLLIFLTLLFFFF